jgi:hypothetical protein
MWAINEDFLVFKRENVWDFNLKPLERPQEIINGRYLLKTKVWLNLFQINNDFEATFYLYTIGVKSN